MGQIACFLMFVEACISLADIRGPDKESARLQAIMKKDGAKPGLILRSLFRSYPCHTGFPFEVHWFPVTLRQPYKRSRPPGPVLDKEIGKGTSVGALALQFSLDRTTTSSKEFSYVISKSLNNIESILNTLIAVPPQSTQA